MQRFGCTSAPGAPGFPTLLCGRRLERQELTPASSPPAGAGLAVPFALDPSIILTGAGSINPLRQVSRIETITTNEWRGISAEQVTAAYQAEATEVADASPTIVQPTITTRRGTAFVPFSMELSQDWAGASQELARVLGDARDNLDAEKMLVSGTAGSFEPVGILNIGVTGALTTSQRVLTNATTTFGLVDVWNLKAAIPARHSADTVTLANPKTLDAAYRFVGGGSTEPPVLPSREGPLFGKPVFEASQLVNTTTAGSKLMVAGDFKTGHVIIDRLGFQVELIPHLFGPANRFPTGQRGLLAVWRSGAGVVAASALRYLEVR